MIGYRFLVRDAGVLTSAKIWYVEGVLQSGTIRSGSTATADTAVGRVSVRVNNVAMLTAANREPHCFTLSIEQPPFDLQILRGVVLESGGNSDAAPIEKDGISGHDANPPGSGIGRPPPG